MLDREKVIDYLKWSIAEAELTGHTSITLEPLKDALTLLKEQEEGVTPIESTTEQKKFADRIGFAVSEYWCGNCHFNLFNRPKFCPNCGKKVKWDA